MQTQNKNPIVLPVTEFWSWVFGVKCQRSNVKCSHRGFTLIETMVALTIVLVAVVGPISLIGNSLGDIYYARDQMVAINLAQEGIEVVRQKRDSNLLAGVAWNTGLTDSSYFVDAGKSPPLITCSSCDQKIYLDGSTGLYYQGVTGTATQFSRIVTTSIPLGGDTHERTITSTVTWNTGNKAGTITATEYLFNMPAL